MMSKTRKKNRTKKAIGAVFGAAALAGVGVAVYFGFKKGIIPQIFSQLKKTRAMEMPAELISDIPPVSDPCVNLTGTRKTATELGSNMLVSSRDINRRLNEKGFTVRAANGDWQLTDFEKTYGETTHKVRAWGASFTNNEWDEAVIPILFAPEEIAEAERKWALVKTT